jgi:hypothetical protein
VLATNEWIPLLLGKLGADLCSKRKETALRNGVNDQSPVCTNFLEKRMRENANVELSDKFLSKRFSAFSA